MRDELATVLRLVAEGKLSPDEAAPIIEALTGPRPRDAGRDSGQPDQGGRGPRASGAGTPSGDARRRRVRIQVKERGRRVVDVRVPLTFAAMAARMVPGMPEGYAALIEQATESDTQGPIVDTEDENGDGVLITLE
ncbi:MAG TPA: hypothetical protein VEW45_08965 [Candidatus Dormibacteraeota bacterium]|nr:hypothetical protein [Candidatus Dormibacteraeota bacterium]